MDAGLAAKTAVNMVGSHAQPAIAFSSAAPTELPADKAVRPVVKSDVPRNDAKKAETGKSTTRDAIIDPETSEVVYRVLDARTRQVVHQEPDKAMLRQQAYIRAKAACALASGGNVVDATQKAAAHVLDTLT
jgi:hypothetical protein